MLPLSLMRAKFLDDLTLWAGAILDRLLLEAPEEIEDEIAETAMERVLPCLALSTRAMLNDNDDPCPFAVGAREDHCGAQG